MSHAAQSDAQKEGPLSDKQAAPATSNSSSDPAKGSAEGKDKKASPFLASKPSESPTSGQDQETSMKKQHDDIDKTTQKNAIFSSTCKLYYVSERTKKMEVRGEGKIIILSDDSGLYKILMIRDQVMLTGCNHYISKTCPLSKATKVPRSWIWVALNDQCDAEDKKDKTTYFATFKTEKDSETFAKVYAECQIKNAEIAEKLQAKNKQK